MKKFFPIFLILALSLSACKVGRFFVYNFADINDHKKFPKRNLKASENPFKFHEPEQIKPRSFKVGNKEMDFEEYLEKNKTVSFLIIRRDSILYEKYFHKYNQGKVVPSFSVAKSFTSALIGCALKDGYINSLDEPMVMYIPELKAKGFGKVTIRHLLQMTSGLDFNESYYNPFGDAATFYYGTNLRKSISKMKLKAEPGTRFEYQSGNTQLLGLVLERALRDKSITQYLQEKIWSPLGMESDASWSIDRKINGLEKTFCCINATARDFAKFGRLYLNKGTWNGAEIIPRDFYLESISRDTTSASPLYYQYQWWMPQPEYGFMAQGILGQYIYVNPEKQLIIVRQGSNYGDVSWWRFFVELSKNL